MAILCGEEHRRESLKGLHIDVTSGQLEHDEALPGAMLGREVYGTTTHLVL